jgi:predicted DsbA family dithiol-disulfide isomerase
VTSVVMKIEVVSDVACPWCAVGVSSLDKAIAGLAGELDIELSFQPFELNPDMGPEGEDVVPYLGAKYGIDEAQIRRNQQAIRERGAAVGFAFGERARVWNTFDAHRLLHWAALEGRQGELKRALLHAYHGDGRNPGSREVLLDLATQVGLDATRAAQILGSDEVAPEVRAEQHQWLQAGIQSVPAVVVNRRHLISGAHPPEVFADALRRIAAQTAA